jgi:sulfur carrier protein
MLVTINNKPVELAEGSSLETLVESKKLNRKAIILGLNGQIVPPENWQDSNLKNGDVLEIIQLIGGG